MEATTSGGQASDGGPPSALADQSKYTTGQWGGGGGEGRMGMGWMFQEGGGWDSSGLRGDRDNSRVCCCSILTPPPLEPGNPTQFSLVLHQ